MKRTLFVTQDCLHCFSILSFIYVNEVYRKLPETEIEIIFYKKDNDEHVALMRKALDYLEEERNDPILGSQDKVTPVLIEQKRNGDIKKVHLGSRELVEYLSNI